MDQRPKFDDLALGAESLDPEDRLRLIARIWTSLPEDYWAAPSAKERTEVSNLLISDDSQRLAGVPSKIAQRIIGPPPIPDAKVYSAPRRFDLATIFVVTFAYSLMFAGMSAFAFHPLASVVVGAFITIVGVCQALLFGGRHPRLASILTGAVINLPLTLGMGMLAPRSIAFDYWLVGLPTSFILGGVFGYISGTLVGGVFLVADVVRAWHVRRTNRDTNNADDDVQLEAR